MNAGTLLRLNQRLARYGAWVVTSLLILLAYVLLFWLATSINRPPPVHYTQSSYEPERPAYCPGQTVTYTSNLIVTTVPAVVIVVRTLWNVEQNVAYSRELNPTWYVWTADLKDIPVIRNTAFALPLELPDGPYEIRVGASTINGAASTYRVPFMVGKKCAGAK